MKLSALLLLIAVSACRAKLEITAGNVTVLVGEDATIPCTYTTEAIGNATITWSARKADGSTQRLYVARVGDPSKSHDDKNAPKRTPAITANADGSLVISATTLQDNTVYGKLNCEVEIGAYKKNKDLDFLAALLPTSDPEMRISDYNPGKSGFDVQENLAIGTCKSAKSYPPAKVTFYEYGKVIPVFLPLGPLAPDIGDSQTVRETDDGVSKTTENELVKNVNISDHRADFTCNIKTVYGDQVYEKNYTMPKFNVNFKTSMVKFDDSPVAYLGETITLTCEANGFPAPEIRINNETGATMEVTVSKDLNGKKYVCTARNSEMRISAASIMSEPYVLNVLSLDKPTLSGDIAGGDTQVRLGEEISVKCTAEGNPTPTIRWYKGEDMVSETGQLRIAMSKFSDSGDYSCRADNGHENLAEATSLHVEVNGINLDGEAEESVTGKKDETVTLSCTVNANPKPDFEWSLDGEAVESGDGSYSHTSHIDIGPLTPELSEKEYTCTATGHDGTTVTKTFKLPATATDTPKDTESTREISAGSSSTAIIIVILVLILVVAIVLAVLYNKGIICKKSEEKGEESAEGDIEAAMNNEDDVEAGNGKATQPAEDEEEQPATSNAEEEKLMAGNED